MLGAGIGFAEVPLNESEIGKLGESIKGRYENHIYTVNAWSKIKCGGKGSAEGRKKRIGRGFINNKRQIGI